MSLVIIINAFPAIVHTFFNSTGRIEKTKKFSYMNDFPDVNRIIYDNLLNPSSKLSRKANENGEKVILNDYKKGINISLGVSCTF